MDVDADALIADLDPDQRAAVTAASHLVAVVAGAGSGKTRVLTHRIAHLVHEGVHPSKILAITFTNKAASEMRERVHELRGLLGERGPAVCVSGQVIVFNADGTRAAYAD